MRLPGPKNPENWQNLHRVAKLGLGTMAGREVTFFESLEGLEARFNGECAVLKDYRTFKQMVMHYRQRELPPAFYFEPYKTVICPSANC